MFYFELVCLSFMALLHPLSTLHVSLNVAFYVIYDVTRISLVVIAPKNAPTYF